MTGQSLQLAFTIVPEFGETVEVVAESSAAGEVEILESRRQAPVVRDLISAAEIRKTPDSNASSVVERLTGVTLLGGKYVFVRGLGERYSGATINGSALAQRRRRSASSRSICSRRTDPRRTISLPGPPGLC